MFVTFAAALAAMPSTLRVSTMSNHQSSSAPLPPPPALTSTASAAGAASAPPAAVAATTVAGAASSPTSCTTCRRWASATPRSLPNQTLLQTYQSKLHLPTTDHEKTSIEVQIFENKGYKIPELGQPSVSLSIWFGLRGGKAKSRLKTGKKKDRNIGKAKI